MKKHQSFGEGFSKYKFPLRRCRKNICKLRNESQVTNEDSLWDYSLNEMRIFLQCGGF